LRKFFIFSIILIVFIAIYNFIYSNEQINLQNANFTVEAWQNEPFKRIYIVEDLHKKHSLVSMNKNEILDLLGKQHCTITDKSITYTLGKKKSELFFSYLTLSFDENGRVSKTYIYQD